MKRITTHIEKYFFIIPLLFVVIVKLPHLSLPYFWDEAWSYFPAVYKMYETGPGLLPGALPLWDAKGHPLFFFFIASSWMRLGGTSVFWVHVLPLLISLGTLISTYYIVKKHVNTWAANLAVLLLSVQSLFLAQATFLLPEMLVTLLLLLNIDAYLSKKFWWFAAIASLLVMTKETNIVFIGGFLIFHLLVYLRPGKESRKYIFETIQIAIPLFVYALFLLLHKQKFGSFFFQDHMGYIQLGPSVILTKLKIATEMIFTHYGRNIILLTAVAALFFILINKKKIENKKLLLLLVLQTVLFLIFSALNFYTQRYMLSLLALFMIIAAVLLTQARFRNAVVNIVAIAVITGIPLYFSFTKKSVSDSDLGYVQVVKVHQEMVKYCETQGWKDEPVSASFNLIFCLQNPHLGYVSTEEGFSIVTDLQNFRKSKIFLNECTNYGLNEQLDSIRNENQLVKEFRLKHAWGNIYTRLPVK